MKKNLEKTDYKLKIYYDSLCYLCHHEIEWYRKKDKNNDIYFEDISLESFDAEKEGLDTNQVNKFFHVRKQNGELLLGVDAFIEIWETIDSLNFLAKIGSLSISRLFLKLGYKVFVVVRPHLPRRKCNTDRCA